MFSKRDFKKIDRKSFEIIRKSAYYIELKSKLTGHTWSIYSKQWKIGHRSLEILHKHRDQDPWHLQLRYHPHDIIEAQDMIREHDIWHLNGRKRNN